MYSNKFVVSVKSNGKFLREDDKSIVLLPFGSEYSLYLKNLSSRKAVASISIDGQDVLDGSRIIVPANSYVELDGFMDGNAVKNRFQFVELTKQIEDFRGYYPSDGLIRVEYWFEKDLPYSITYTNIDYPTYYLYWDGNNVYNYSGTTTSPTNDIRIKSCCNTFTAINDGITVEGSETHQSFGNGYIGKTEESNVIVLQLKGYKEDKKLVETFNSTRDKIVCRTCGEKNRSNHKFCTNCGTYLR
jgi:ribosomal protein L32